MSEEVHLDPATLAMLQEILGDSFKGLLETFIKDADDRISGLKAGLAEADADAVRSSAHSLKGSSSNLGAHPLAELCLQMEQNAREGHLVGLDEILSAIEAEFEIVRGHLTVKLTQ
ncbi:Hpt domain-containing protein [Gilvimarinus sp. F26214L]|uniref:Hpt domain-containing protein n=1 Tax=Gilvimarinus sp. DZF01 TaxID=3461371 RepID=UPI004045AF73